MFPFAKVYRQAAATTVADATIVTSTQRAYLCHVKVSTTQTAATAGSFTVETQAGTVLYTAFVAATSKLNQHEDFSFPLRSDNGLKLNADGVLAACKIEIGYVG